MLNRQFVAGMHGNEYLPILALASAGTPHIVANPKAVAIGKRWVESDLNKSFGVDEDSYEPRRAKELLNLIPQNVEVVDFHTSDTADVPFVIIVDPKMLALAKKTGIKDIVYMNYSFKQGHALINFRDGISIEAGKHTNERSFYTTLEVVSSLEKGIEHEVNLYESYGEIEEPGDYINFKPYSAEGEEFVPIFTGKSSYDFIGIKCKKVESFA